MRDPKTCGELHGLRFGIWARCSTNEQADTSIEDQLTPLLRWGEAAGMTHVTNFILEGVSGSSFEVHEMVRRVIQRRQEHRDIDVVLVYDLSRLTRGGALDGAKLEYDLRAAGIRLISVMDDIPDGEFADVFKTFKHFASNAQSRAIALTATRGGMTSIMAGKSSYGRRPPYGVDRLISGPEGPRFLLHNMPDGRQLKLEVGSRRVLTTFEANRRGGSQRHYIKQSDETVSFVPGDPSEVEIVNRIFRLYYQDGWGYKRIAHRFNDEVIPAPGGKVWFEATVRTIVRNPAYTGRGLANRLTSGRYFERTTSGPKATRARPEELSGRRRPKTRQRPAEEWYWTEESGLAGYLDPVIRVLAIAAQDVKFAGEATGMKAPAKPKDKHLESPYLLKHRLVSRQGGYRMTGRTFRRRGKGGLPNLRYYCVTRGSNAPSTRDAVLRKLVPADPLDALIVSLLSRQIAAMPGLKDMIKQMVQRQLDAAKGADDRLAQLQKEADNIHMQMGLVIRNAPLLGEELAAKQLADLAQQKHRIQAEVATLDRGRKLTPDQVDVLVERILSNLQAAADSVFTTGSVMLEKLLDLLIDRIEVDLETRHVSISFALPSWLLDEPDRACLGRWPACRCSPEAEQPSLPLMAWEVYWLGDRYMAVLTAVGASGDDSTKAA